MYFVDFDRHLFAYSLLRAIFTVLPPPLPLSPVFLSSFSLSLSISLRLCCCLRFFLCVARCLLCVCVCVCVFLSVDVSVSLAVSVSVFLSLSLSLSLSLFLPPSLSPLSLSFSASHPLLFSQYIPLSPCPCLWRVAHWFLLQE